MSYYPYNSQTAGSTKEQTHLSLTNPTDYHLKRLKDEKADDDNDDASNTDNSKIYYNQQQQWGVGEVDYDFIQPHQQQNNSFLTQNSPSYNLPHVSTFNRRFRPGTGSNVNYDLLHCCSAGNGNYNHSCDSINNNGYSSTNNNSHEIADVNKTNGNGGLPESYFDLNSITTASNNDENDDRLDELSELFKSDHFNDLIKPAVNGAENYSISYGDVGDDRICMSCPKDIYFPGKVVGCDSPRSQSSRHSNQKFKITNRGGEEDNEDNSKTFSKDKIRKYNHNRVERARRDNINYRIKEIATLLPGSIDLKQNKGTILKASVNYLKECQNLETKIKRLEERQAQLESLCRKLIDKIQILERIQTS